VLVARQESLTNAPAMSDTVEQSAPSTNKVFGGMSQEILGIVGRLGQVIYWVACCLAILAVPGFLLLAYLAVGRFGFLDFTIGLACGFCFWLIGRAARYILKGD